MRTPATGATDPSSIIACMEHFFGIKTLADSLANSQVLQARAIKINGDILNYNRFMQDDIPDKAFGPKSRKLKARVIKINGDILDFDGSMHDSIPDKSLPEMKSHNQQSLC